jgi:hypothetical protein
VFGGNVLPADGKFGRVPVSYLHIGLVLGGLTLISGPYLRSRLGLERTQRLSYTYLTAGFGFYLATTILFEGLFGFELLPDVSDKLGGVMMFPALGLFILAGIAFFATSWTASAPDPER